MSKHDYQDTLDGSRFEVEIENYESRDLWRLSGQAAWREFDDMPAHWTEGAEQ